MNDCSIEGCSSPVKARGWCGKHWTRWRSTGSPNGLKRQSHQDHTGKRFGKLVALEDSGFRKHGQRVWVCSCDCGSIVFAQAGNLRSGNTQSCGCLQKERAASAATKHGGAKSSGHDPEYTTWWSMIARCKYPSTYAYPWYGGKGISVCDHWSGEDGYRNFLQDMGKRPGKGWSIDRIDPLRNYEPSNCRWLPISENSARAHRIEH